MLLTDSSRFRFRYILAILTIHALGAGCHHVREQPQRGPENDRLSFSCSLLDPDPNKEVRFLVESFTGETPSKASLDKLLAVARSQGGGAASYVFAGEQSHEEELLKDCLGRGGRTSCVLVRYLGVSFGGDYGSSDLRQTTVDGHARTSGRINLYLDNARHYWPLFRSREDLETEVLIHEYGHLLGLVANERHASRWGVPEGVALDHCKHASCIMSDWKPSTVIYRFGRIGIFRGSITDFCKECREDLLKQRDVCRSNQSSAAAPSE